MDDLNALERQIAGQLNGFVGPIRPVDDAAIFTAIIATQSPKWKFQSLFSATRFVVAGAIVALFGGFLLAGVLTQPSEERLPAVGASASASSEPAASPDPDKQTAAPTDRSTDAVLRGLRSTQVVPGITRIDEDADGWQPLSVKEVSIAPDGSVWVVAAGGRVRQVGGDWLATPIPAKIGDVRDLRVVDATTIVAEGSGLRWWDGRRWLRPSGPDWGYTFASHGSPDDDLWVSGGAEIDPDPTELIDWPKNLGRLSDGEWTWYTSADLGAPGADVFDFADGTDGTLWAAANAMIEMDGSGILRFDGARWESITPPGFEAWPELRATDVEVTPDGSIWYLVRPLGLEGPSDPHLLRWDGIAWTAHPAPRELPRGLRAASDGTLWVGGEDWPGYPGQPRLWRFDGERWWQPVWDEDVADVAIADDGMLWVVTSNGRLVVVDPDAVEYTEVVSEHVAAEPAAVEPFDEAEPAVTTSIPDLLPGVDLVTEEVEPGVYRVLSDGVRDLAGRIVDVTVTPEGDAWVERGTPGDWSIVRLGEPGVSQKLGQRNAWELGSTAGGTPVISRVSDGATRAFDGASWRTTELSEYEACSLWATERPALGVDGDCYTTDRSRFTDDETLLVRVDADGTRTALTRTGLGLGPELNWIWHPLVGPDGTIWAAVLHTPDGATGFFEGLVRYDGTSWSFIPYDGDDAELCGVCFGSTAVDEDGVVWIGRQVSDAPLVLTWDGVSWRSDREDERGLLDPPWGGRTLATAPDGSAWTVMNQKLYVITPEAVFAAD